MIEQVLPPVRIGILPQRIAEGYDGRVVTLDLVIRICIQVCLLVHTPRQVVGHILEKRILLALGIVRHELRDRNHRLTGHRLVTRGARTHVVETDGIHGLGILQKRTAPELVTEVVQQRRRRKEIVILELAAGDIESDRILLHRTGEVVFAALEKQCRLIPLLGIVIQHAAIEDKICVVGVYHLLDSGTAAEQCRKREDEG